jgi:hypothetical protein
MNKALFVTEQELLELVKLNFSVQADTNVTEVEVDEETITTDVIEIKVDEENLHTIVNNLKDKLNITGSEIHEGKDKDGNKILIIDFMDLTTLLEEKYDVELTANYQPCCCDLFENPVLAFEIR